MCMHFQHIAPASPTQPPLCNLPRWSTRGEVRQSRQRLRVAPLAAVPCWCAAAGPSRRPSSGSNGASCGADRGGGAAGGRQDLADAIEQMWEGRRYRRLLLFVETCEAETLTAAISSPNVFTIATSKLGTSSPSAPPRKCR